MQRTHPSLPKVWGIGLSRTGTMTLAEAMAKLGYRSAHFILPEDFGRFDAVTDITAAVRFRELDERFPGSKFVLTLRDEEDWAESYRRHVSKVCLRQYNARWLREILHCRTRAYGTLGFDRERCLAGFRRHTAEVLAYFAQRPADLLIMRVREGDGWAKLCRFVGSSEPAESFPNVNKSGEATKGLRLSCLSRHDLAGSE